MILITENTPRVGGNPTAEMDALIAEEGIAPGGFSDDDTGAMEICLEVETSWGALRGEMAAIEHAAILEASPYADLAVHAAEWWRKMAEFFKRIWASIASWFEGAMAWINTRLRNAEKWWEENGDKITVKETTYSTYPSVTHATGLVHPIAVMQKLFKSIVNANSEAELEEYGKGMSVNAFTQEFLGSSSRQTLRIHVADLSVNLKGVKNILGLFKSIHENQGRIVQTALNIAKLGGRSRMNSDGSSASVEYDPDAKKRAAEIELAKSKISLSKRLDSIAMRCVNIIISDSFMIGRKMLAESKATATSRSAAAGAA
jgi:hypothetical protein